MTVDGKKIITKKNMFNTEVGNVTFSSGIICFANARKYFEKIILKRF